MTQTRFQIVGSLLRPALLLAYKGQIEHRDDITYPFYTDFPGYQATETAAIRDVVAKEKAHGLDVLTDGEYSKSMWHLDFLWGFGGIQRKIVDHGYRFEDHDGGDFETRKDIGLAITAPLSGKHHHFIDIFKALKAQAGGTAVKTTVWGAAHAYTELTFFDHLYGAGQVYETKAALKAGLIHAYQEFLTEYKAAGGEIVQFDDCLWELFSSDNPSGFYAANGANIEALADEFVAINNAVCDFGHALGLKVWTHNCRGNYASRHAAGGSYATIAKKFLGDQHYDRFFLEWDDERAGAISALAALQNRPDVEVVLGVLSSKISGLDDEDRALRLLNQAAAILPKDHLYLSHQCGFASCDGGNELTESQQWAKIDQGQRLAKAFWGEA